MDKKIIDYVQKYIFEINIPVMKVEEIDEEKAIFSMDVTENMCNVYGIAHGGVLYSLADTACGIHSTAYRKNPVTLNSSFNFINPCKSGQKIYAISKIQHMGKSTAVLNVSCQNGEGKVFAIGTFTVFNNTNYPEKREVNNE